MSCVTVVKVVNVLCDSCQGGECPRSGVGNLSLDAGEKQALQGMVGRTNFHCKVWWAVLIFTARYGGPH